MQFAVWLPLSPATVTAKRGEASCLQLPIICFGPAQWNTYEYMILTCSLNHLSLYINSSVLAFGLLCFTQHNITCTVCYFRENCSEVTSNVVKGFHDTIWPKHAELCTSFCTVAGGNLHDRCGVFAKYRNTHTACDKNKKKMLCYNKCSSQTNWRALHINATRGQSLLVAHSIDLICETGSADVKSKRV